ncbi:MAG: VOC family protein [Chloroflexi bacterium]|nr:VOC family protein [Chloroflexota bacterium]
MPRVVHFEVYADDMDRASKFYGDVFGWSVTKIELDGGAAYWLIDTGEEPAEGINGGMMPRPTPEAINTVVLDVSSVDEYVEKITEGGGTVLVPKFAVPGVGYAAYFNDTEGNPFGIFEDNNEAA